MIVIKFSVHNQRLRRITPGIIPSTAYGKIKLEFDFRTDDWNTVETKIANFYYNGENETVNLDEYNQCFIPEAVFCSPSFKISVFGGDIVTNTINIFIEGNKDIKPSAYEELLRLINEHTHEEYVEEDKIEEVLPDTFDAGKIIERG